jgi:hypothetical protein
MNLPLLGGYSKLFQNNLYPSLTDFHLDSIDMDQLNVYYQIGTLTVLQNMIY